MRPGDTVEQMHPDLVSKFPSLICKLSDRDQIQKFAKDNKLVVGAGMMRLRTDGVVITLLDPKVQSAIGRDNHINGWEVALKQENSSAYSKVKDVIFETSEFGFITPVVVFQDVTLDGNTVQRASLHNKERFDELDLYYGDMVLVEYSIIPSIRKDENCHRWNSAHNR
jgi:NAD-dependent DNA ligase